MEKKEITMTAVIIYMLSLGMLTKFIQMEKNITKRIHTPLQEDTTEFMYKKIKK